jgi:uncharacterized protein YpmB
MNLGITELIIVVLAVIAVVVIIALASVLFVTKVMTPRSKGRREAGSGEGRDGG